MEVTQIEIPEVLIIKPKRYVDHRGFFLESWNKKTFEGIGIFEHFVQDNHLLSESVGTLRGLHFQYLSVAQAKPVRRGCSSL